MTDSSAREPDELIPPGGAADTGVVLRSDEPGAPTAERDSPPERDSPMVLQVLFFQLRFLRYLFRVALSGDVSFAWKLRALAALVYVVSPVDFVPEMFVGPFGLFDDVALFLVTVTDLFERMPRDVFTRGWGSGVRLARLVGKALAYGVRIIPGPIRHGLQSLLGEPGSGAARTGGALKEPDRTS